MDRKEQLRNVAFGGAWSEQIAENEALVFAMQAVEEAQSRTGEEDLRLAVDMVEAIETVCAAHPKGTLLSDAWFRALNIPNPGLRSRELARIASTIREALGDRIGPKGA